MKWRFVFAVVYYFFISSSLKCIRKTMEIQQLCTNGDKHSCTYMQSFDMFVQLFLELRRYAGERKEYLRFYASCFCRAWMFAIHYSENWLPMHAIFVPFAYRSGNMYRCNIFAHAWNSFCSPIINSCILFYRSAALRWFAQELWPCCWFGCTQTHCMLLFGGFPCCVCHIISLILWHFQEHRSNVILICVKQCKKNQTIEYLKIIELQYLKHRWKTCIGTHRVAKCSEQKAIHSRH